MTKWIKTYNSGFLEYQQFLKLVLVRNLNSNKKTWCNSVRFYYFLFSFLLSFKFELVSFIYLLKTLLKNDRSQFILTVLTKFHGHILWQFLLINNKTDSWHFYTYNWELMIHNIFLKILLEQVWYFYVLKTKTKIHNSSFSHTRIHEHFIYIYICIYIYYKIMLLRPSIFSWTCMIWYKNRHELIVPSEAKLYLFIYLFIHLFPHTHTHTQF